MPALIHVSALTDEQPEWFEALTRILLRETDAALPGGASVVNRLAEVLFIHVLRAYAAKASAEAGFLRAMHDRQISRALRAIHETYAGKITLQDIARHAGLSRSYLAARFKEVLGETPMDHVTRWLLLQARQLLMTSSSGLSDIAEQVGYQSESAFSHAYKRYFGVGPGSFPRLAGQGR